MITYGEPPDIGFDFEILGEAFTDSGNAQLVKWVSDAEKTKSYPPITPPTPKQNCHSVQITVHKVS
jgi:hypothetical protein